MVSNTEYRSWLILDQWNRNAIYFNVFTTVLCGKHLLDTLFLWYPFFDVKNVEHNTIRVEKTWSTVRVPFLSLYILFSVHSSCVRVTLFSIFPFVGQLRMLSTFVSVLQTEKNAEYYVTNMGGMEKNANAMWPEPLLFSSRISSFVTENQDIRNLIQTKKKFHIFLFYLNSNFHVL